MYCEKLQTPNCNCEDCRPDLYKESKMNMTKDDALKKIEEAEKAVAALKEYVKECDKPKLVRVYVKEGNKSLHPHPVHFGAAQRWFGDMENLAGKLFNVDSLSIHGSVTVKGWELRTEWLVFVEGSYEDLQRA